MNDKMLKNHINECLKRICTIKGFMSDKDADKYGCEENVSILESAIEACKKQISKKPLNGGNTDKLTGDIFICPSCSGVVGIDDMKAAYCADCGQKLDWEN